MFSNLVKSIVNKTFDMDEVQEVKDVIGSIGVDMVDDISSQMKDLAYNMDETMVDLDSVDDNDDEENNKIVNRSMKIEEEIGNLINDLIILTEKLQAL